jgi:hypothetical protein
MLMRGTRAKVLITLRNSRREGLLLLIRNSREGVVPGEG